MTLPCEAAPGESCADLESHERISVVTGTVTMIEPRPQNAMIQGFTITASVPSLDCGKLTFIVSTLATCQVGDRVFAMGAVQQSQDKSWVLEPPDEEDPTIAEDRFSCRK